MKTHQPKLQQMHTPKQTENGNHAYIHSQSHFSFICKIEPHAYGKIFGLMENS